MFDATTLETLTRRIKDVESPHERAVIFMQTLIEASGVLARQDDADSHSCMKEARDSDKAHADEMWGHAIWAAEKAALTGGLWLAVKAAKEAAQAAASKAG